ncbi:putative vegetative incompatibility WD repeat protein [Penicillium brasilianum]|uniref:Putative vegetative incompatibility WD repeat protein n=1 Tax=Penicillium brasilianum TaxID=104259 RepID=A0A1S9RM05_PENBI|nr:putative vegetative incompatibility WD repeat protein [Penicillium brasilianum]
MSLLSLTSEIVGILDRLQTAKLDLDSSTSDFIHDAKRFILKNHWIVDRAPLQVYCAGLIFAPRTAIIYSKFTEELPAWIYRLPRVQETWSAEIQALEGHSGPISSLTFSPDGYLLASCSETSIQLWDATTGTLQHTIVGYKNILWNIFSPDSCLLASLSADNTVRLWDVATGTLLQTLEGRSYRICSAVFSLDCKLLVSGCSGSSIRLWYISTDILEQTLEGHTSSIRSAVFSTGSQLLASFSGKTVRIWDTTTGTLRQNLEGHTDSIWSVVFSPDCRLLASISNNTIRLWDTTTFGISILLLQWHHPSVGNDDGHPTANFRESQRISSDGALQHTFEHHTNSVRSVIFAPDSRILASGSFDGTIWLWDTTAVASQQTVKDYSDSITSIAFSPDCALLLSTSKNGMVGLWNVAMGVLKQNLEGHLNKVLSVAYSPDGQMLASTSGDNTVRIWYIATGTPVASRIKGKMVGFQSSTEVPNSSNYPTSLEVQRWFGNKARTDTMISVLDKVWVTLNGKKVLWLPPEYRPICYAVMNNHLALGHKSGLVTFLCFVLD